MARARLLLIVVALIALVLPARAADVTFRGEVTYRERVALTRDAQLIVSLVALTSGAPVASATALVRQPAQVPFNFVLNVRSTVLRAGTAYGLVAEIRSGGRRLFRSATPLPVEPVSPEPVRLIVNYAPGPRAATNEADLPAPPPHPLLDSQWTFTSIAGRPVAADAAATFAVAFDHRVTGTSGCNDYFAELDMDTTRMQFGPVAGTRKACAAAIMDQEAALFAALTATRGFEEEGDSLRLLDAAGVPLAGLVRER